MSQLDATKKLMGALVRMKPKLHDEMKVGATKKKVSKSKKPKKASLGA